MFERRSNQRASNGRRAMVEPVRKGIERDRQKYFRFFRGRLA